MKRLKLGSKMREIPLRESERESAPTHPCNKQNEPCDWELLYNKAARERDIARREATDWQARADQYAKARDACFDQMDALSREVAELRAALVEIANYSAPSTVQPVLIASALLARVRP